MTTTQGFKYSKNGLYSSTNLSYLNLPQGISTTLAKILNHSIAKGTWSTYQTVARMLMKCQSDTGARMDFPLDTKRIIIFVHYLFTIRKVSASTANTYLSGLRYLHIVRGSEIPMLRPPIIEQLIKGKQHIDSIERTQMKKPRRAPVTLNIMKLLKKEIITWDASNEDKALVWTTCTVLFAGCLRIHEILSRKQTEFDPDFTLLGTDVILKKIRIGKEQIKILQIRLKSPKEDRIGVGKIIDIYQSEGPICPIKAFERWDALRTWRHKKSPLFRLKDGSCLTGRKLNSLMKIFLKPHLDYKKGMFTSHSFRAGMATLMGTLGFSDEEIMAMGRWSSEAYLNYLKLPRTRRIEIARKIGNSLN